MPLAQTARQVLADPVEAGIRLWGLARERAERARLPPRYDPDPGWEARLHAALGHTHSVRQRRDEADAVWPLVQAALADGGVKGGPASYGGHNDGDPAFVRAIWCLVRGLQAAKVVETGVAHGVTSRFILEAQALNGGGRLWSIDLPPPTRPGLHREIGMAVDAREPFGGPADAAARWHYIHGSSRRRLPRLLRELGAIDLFVHDSLHAEHNMLFEMRAAWPALRPGGAMVVDDIDLNAAFRRFVAEQPGHLALACPHRPLRPDPLRKERGLPGLFGIILKREGDAPTRAK